MKFLQLFVFICLTDQVYLGLLYKQSHYSVGISFFSFKVLSVLLSAHFQEDEWIKYSVAYLKIWLFGEVITL